MKYHKYQNKGFVPSISKEDVLKVIKKLKNIKHIEVMYVNSNDIIIYTNVNQINWNAVKRVTVVASHPFKYLYLGNGKHVMATSIRVKSTIKQKKIGPK